MEKFFKYIGYIAASLLIAWLSTIGKEDFLKDLSHSIVQLLIALLALYSTISSLLVSRLLNFKKEINQNAGIKPVVKEMKRNVKIESWLILFTLLVIIVSNVFLKYEWLNTEVVSIFRNTVVVFTLMYFVIVVYDSAMGLYDLLQYSKDESIDSPTE